MIRPWRRFRSELVLYVMLCVTVALLLASAAFIRFDVHSSRESILGQLREQAQYLGIAVAAARRFQADPVLDNTLETLRRNDHILLCAVLDADNKIITAISKDNAPVVFHDKPDDSDHLFASDHLDLYAAIRVDGGEQLTVVMRRDLSELREHIRHNLMVTGIAFIIIMGITMLITFGFQHVLTRPLVELIRTVRTISEKRDYSVRAQKYRHDEFGLLTDHINDMIDQLAERERERQSTQRLLEERVDERTRELRESEQHLRTAVLEAPFPVMIHAEDGEVILMSHVWTDLTGYTREDMPTIETMTRRMCEKQAPEVYRHISALYDIRERVEEGSFEIHTRDGQTRTWDFRSAPLGRQPDGRRVVISMAVDLTDRLATEKRINESITRMELATRATRIGYWDWNIKTNEVFFSPEWKQQIGYGPDELEDTFETWANLLHPDDRDTTIQAVQDFLDGTAPEYNVTFRLRHKDGSYRWILTRAEELRDRQGATERIMGCHVDITPMKEAEAKVQEAMEELKRSNAELEQFAYVASHDLQEPLRMVTSYLQLLESRYAEHLDATAHEFIDFAVDGAKRMRALILDLLAYSRVGTQSRPLVPTSSADALEAAMNSLSVLLTESEVRVDYGELPDVIADESQLIQLFQNLLSNAVKFRSTHPVRIHVSTEPAEETGFVHFKVSDNGIGISEEHHDRIFVIFQRLHKRDAYPGTGIGLAVCQKIVNRHGGRIWVESEPGKGSTFHFTLHRSLPLPDKKP